MDIQILLLVLGEWGIATAKLSNTTKFFPANHTIKVWLEKLERTLKSKNKHL